MLAIIKCQKKRKRKIKNSILESRLIIQIFSNQHNKHQSYNQNIIKMLFLSLKLKGKNFQIIKPLFELQTQVVYNLTDLLPLKTR